MIGFLLGATVLLAVVAAGLKRLHRAHLARRRPGATLARAIAVTRFDEIDAAIATSRCHCGGRHALAGETSRRVADRRFRISRVVCQECGRDTMLYFDVTRALH